MNILGIIVTVIIMILLLWFLSGIAYWAVLIIGVILIINFISQNTGSGPVINTAGY